jgi:hypothetical protein
MHVTTARSPNRRPIGIALAIVVLALLPFPVSIPLTVWLTGHRHQTDTP